MTSPIRSRFQQDPELLADRLFVCFKDGKHRIVYGELMGGSPVQSDKLILLAPIIAALRPVQSNLAIPQMLMKNALQLVHKAMLVQKPETWAIKKYHVEDWSEKTAKRIRTACRHVAQAERRKRQVAWLERLWAAESAWIAEPCSATPEPSMRLTDLPRHMNVKDATPSEFYYGWDPELKKAWRVAPDTGMKELAERVYAPADAKDRCRLIFPMLSK